MPIPYPAKTFTSGQTPTTAQWNELNANDQALAAGTGLNTNSVTADKLATSAITIGYAEAPATNQTGITTEVDITGLIVTVSVPTGGRRVEITGYASVNSNVSNDVAQMAIYEGATNLKVERTSLNNASSVGARVAHTFTPSPGTHTYKIRIGRLTGTGNVLIENVASLASITVKVV